MRQQDFSASVITDPALSAALIVFPGLSGGLESGTGVLVLGLGAVALLLLILCEFDPSPSIRGALCRLIAGLVLGFLIAGIGIARVHSPSARFSAALDTAAINELEGHLLHDLRPSSSPYRVVELAVRGVADSRGWSGSARGRIRLIWKGEEYLKTGTTRLMPVRGDLVRVTGFRGINETTDGHGTVLFADGEEIFLEPASGLPSVRRRAREWIRGRLVRLDSRGGAMIPALLLGDRSGLDAELTDAVRASGASHVLALSGMHLGVLAAIFHLGPARWLPRRLRGAVILPFLAVYVWVAGWIPSLLRALILVALTVFTKIRARTVPVPILLARTVLVTAVITPRIVGNIGFQLSLLALSGIVLIAPRLIDELTRILPRPAAAYIGVTLAAMLTTAPISLAVFGTVYPAGLALAGLLSVLIVVQMWSGLVFMVVATVPVVGTILADIIRFNSITIQRAAEWGYLFPVIRVESAWIHAVIVILTGAVLLWPRRSRDKADEPQFDF